MNIEKALEIINGYDKTQFTLEDLDFFNGKQNLDTIVKNAKQHLTIVYENAVEELEESHIVISKELSNRILLACANKGDK